MRLQRETDLNDTEAKQDKTDGTDKTEDEIGQIVDHGNRVAGGKSGNAHTANKSCCCDYGAVSTEAFVLCHIGTSYFFFIVLSEIPTIEAPPYQFLPL